MTSRPIGAAARGPRRRPGAAVLSAPVTLFDPEELHQAPQGPLVRVRLVVAYDGAPFHGFAINPGVRTVGGALTDALSMVLGHPPELTCAGRTDKGVHARAQVVTFDADQDRFQLDSLVRSLNKASTSLLQRRFRIGYTRAARLMDALEDAGIIGPPTGTSKAREVYSADGAPSAETVEPDAPDEPDDGSE